MNLFQHTKKKLKSRKGRNKVFLWLFDGFMMFCLDLSDFMRNWWRQIWTGFHFFLRGRPDNHCVLYMGSEFQLHVCAVDLFAATRYFYSLYTSASKYRYSNWNIKNFRRFNTFFDLYYTLCIGDVCIGFGII